MTSLAAKALLALGRRPIVADGEMTVPAISGAIDIHRDRFGVPHIYAGTDFDAAYGIGFCHGQDRSFQLEVLSRTARGTLAELFGPEVLSVDRLARRIGFARMGAAQVDHLTPEQRPFVDGYAAGVNAGREHGVHRPQHEFTLLRSMPTPFTAADGMSILSLVSFFLASNWDAELARLLVLAEDGAEALGAIEPTYPAWHHVSSPPGATAGVVERLAVDLEALSEWIGVEGASNAWALAAERTTTGRPLLCNDPHLGPLLPPHWYLCHVVTPQWAMAGASFVGGPTIASGHNGYAAWGVTAGLADNTDLFIERIDDGMVDEADGPTPVEVIRESIAVRGGDTVVEEVVVTRRGPVIGPALDGHIDAISMKATWLEPGPVDGLFALRKVRSFDDFRQAFASWPAASFGYVYADTGGTVGYALVGNVPRRRRGDGSIPVPGWLPDAGWHDGWLAPELLPHSENPPGGWVAAANNRPGADIDRDLGRDFIDGYRIGRITELLTSGDKWDVDAALRAQLDQKSGPWADIRDSVLEALHTDDATIIIAGELEAWDGVVSADSATATLFELLWAELDRRIVESRAPGAARWALGAGFNLVAPYGLLGFRRGSRIADLVRTRPQGWFDDGWPATIVAAALAAASRRDELQDPAWGRARALTLRHPLAARPPLDKIFNLGPFPLGGDGSTVNQAGTDPLDPLNDMTLAIASLRTVIDVGEWDHCRFVIPGGQSGNPLSSHYSDQWRLWRDGDALPIAWTRDAVAAATRATLRLTPEIRDNGPESGTTAP